MRPGQRQRSKPQHGFTLIETLVAVSIFALIAPAFLSAIITAFRGNQIADEQIQAEALARTELDAVLASAYNTNPACYPNTCYPVTGTPPGQYDVVITAQPIDAPTCGADGNCNTLQLVTVSISRPTGGGGSRTVLSVSTYKVKR